MDELSNGVLQSLARRPFVRAVARRFIPAPLRRVIGSLLGLPKEALVGAIARRLIPGPLRSRIIKLFIPPPDVRHFRALMSQTMALDPVPGRVVIVCGSLQPGGAERQAANTAIGLASCPNIESITILCDYLHGGTTERYDFYVPLAQKSGATIREIGKLPFDIDDEPPPTGLQEVKRRLHPGLTTDVMNLYREFRSLRPEVVHALLDWSNVRAGLAAVLAGVPRVLLSGRNLSPPHFALNADYFRPAYRALSERDPKQVVLLNNSQAGADDYSTWLSLPSGRIKVIRNGVQFTEDMRPSLERIAAYRAKLGIPAHAPVIGGMFRFDSEKRPLLWLQVANLVAQTLPDSHFLLFGRGSMRKQMEALVLDFGLTARVHFCGTVTPSLDGLALCDLIMLTSHGEGTPNVLLEAQWLGLPVVTTDVGGAAEAVSDGRTGLVVREDNESAIANAVLRILKDNIFCTHARLEGPPFISARYGMERMINETLAAYGWKLSPCMSETLKQIP